MISKQQLRFKRIFDFVFGIVLLPILIVPIIVCIVFATIETREFGIFSHIRIGQHGKPFRFYKIRTLNNSTHQLGNLKSKAGVYGNFMRNTRLDEFPQIFHVIFGTMSFVGPRPDVPGFADRLEGEDRIILMVKPGITGPATLKYQNEEQLLAKEVNPQNYNRAIIWKDKVKMNKDYVMNWSFYLDLKIIMKSMKSICIKKRK